MSCLLFVLGEGVDGGVSRKGSIKICLQLSNLGSSEHDDAIHQMGNTGGGTAGSQGWQT